MNRFFIGNCSQLVAVKSDMGLPLRGKKQSDLTIIPNGCVVIQDGLIQDFGLEKDLSPLYETYPYFDAKKHILLPSFVDPHTHLVFSGTREEEFLCRLSGESYLGTLEKGQGIFSTVKATKETSEEELFYAAMERIKIFKKTGTIGLEIKSGYGLDFETELKMLRVINRIKTESDVPVCRTFLAAHALPIEYKDNREDYIEYICDKMIPLVASENLADCIDVFCERGIFSAQESRRILLRGKELGLQPKIHVDEFASIGGLSVACELDALSVDHLIMSKEDELLKCSHKNIVAVILPGTSFAMKIEDLSYGRKIIDSNIPLAIGTDYNPGTCMCSSMQMMLELSVLKFGLNIKEVINASTINAAFACGIDQLTGSIEKGKRADLVILGVDNYTKIPYFWGVNKLDALFVKGEVVSFA